MKAKTAFKAMGQSDRANRFTFNYIYLSQCSIRAKQWYFIGFYGY